MGSYTGNHGSLSGLCGRIYRLPIYGLREKDYYTASLFRRVAAAAWLGHGNKFDKFDKFWPDAKHKTIKPDSRALNNYEDSN